MVNQCKVREVLNARLASRAGQIDGREVAGLATIQSWRADGR
jgi:hypothetical protein